MSTIKMRQSRSDYISQLPPETLLAILQNCVKWFKPPRKSRTGHKYDPDECAITRAIFGAIASTCRYFRDTVCYIKHDYAKTTNAFISYNSCAFDNLFRIASRDFIKSIAKLVDPSNAYAITPTDLSTNLINYVVAGRGGATALMDLRRIGALRNYTYNSASFVAQIDKPGSACYAARYRLIEDVSDLNRNVEGVPGNVAVRVVNNWIRRMHASRRLKQCDLDRALNLIIRAHPRSCHWVINMILRMRSARSTSAARYDKQNATSASSHDKQNATSASSHDKQNATSASSHDKQNATSASSHTTWYCGEECKFVIQDNEIALYAVYRGDSEYCRWLMLQLNLDHRMRILASLPVAPDKYNTFMHNWDIPVSNGLMVEACRQFNRTLAQLCRKYSDGIKDLAARAQMNATYSRHFCPTLGACCNNIVSCGGNTYITASTITPTITASTIAASTIASTSMSGLCYSSCPSGYTNTYQHINTHSRMPYMRAYSGSSAATCTCNQTANAGYFSSVVPIERGANTSIIPYNVYPNEYQPSGSVNMSRITSTTMYNDPAAKFIRYGSIFNGANSGISSGFGRHVEISIPRYGDLIAGSTITLGFN